MSVETSVISYNSTISLPLGSYLIMPFVHGPRSQCYKNNNHRKKGYRSSHSFSLVSMHEFRFSRFSNIGIKFFFLFVFFAIYFFTSAKAFLKTQIHTTVFSFCLEIDCKYFLAIAYFHLQTARIKEQNTFSAPAEQYQ